MKGDRGFPEGETGLDKVCYGGLGGLNPWQEPRGAPSMILVSGDRMGQPHYKCLRDFHG
jgi:hypothetical protein